MSKKSESSKVVSKYRICWLETRLVSATVDATSPEEALKNAADYNGDLVTVVYGEPMPKSLWCVDEDVPQSIVEFAESLGVDMEFVDEELERFSDPGVLEFLQLIETGRNGCSAVSERKMVLLNNCN